MAVPLEYKSRGSMVPDGPPLSTLLRIAVTFMTSVALLTLLFGVFGFERIIWEGGSQFVLEWFPFRVQWMMCAISVFVCAVSIRRREPYRGLAVALIVLCLFWSGCLALFHHRTLESVRENDPNWPGWGHF